MAKQRDADSVWAMDELENGILDLLSQNEEYRALPPKKLAKIIAKTTEKTAKAIAKDLAFRAPKMLAQWRKETAGFERRNFRRWRKAFDRIEMIWVCCEEVGRNFNQHFRPEAVQSQNFVFEALTSIHAKSLLVAAEMICLMKGGFPDAALTRWRTLYELNVVGTLIVREGQDLALRYLAHADVQAAKAYDGTEGVSDADLRELQARAAYAVSNFGNELTKHYGWACALTGKKQPNFEDLERLADKTDGRSIYKQASQHIHSNHRKYDELLGVSESNENMLLVGRSNSGMVGPLTLASLTMVETTSLYLLTQPNFDRSVYSIVLMRLAAPMHSLAERLERRTFEAAQKRRAHTSH